MKKLNLSMLPIDLKVGEEMEVLTPKGDKVTVRCVEDKRGEACETCIFGDNGLRRIIMKEVIDFKRKGDLESMCKEYLCMRERTLDCLVFKVVKEKFK